MQALCCCRHTHWSGDASNVRAGYAAEPSPDSDAPSLVTAIEEQLGLKLDATTGPVDVLVVEGVQRPTPD
jgi:uncharacterized protein (TIGR03435 family)